MDEDDFEGTLVLEQLAELGMVDDFFEAIDSDDIEEAIKIMKKARVDATTIAIVVEKIMEGEN